MEPIISSKAITREEKYLLELLADSKFIKDFYLAGGTALAIYYGHRESVDLDFFSKKTFDSSELLSKLEKSLKSRCKVSVISTGTLYIKYKKTNLSFLNYNYPLLEKSLSYKNLRIAQLKDIGAMKIAAIVGRNTKKDFIDLFFLLKNSFNLSNLISLYIKKYGNEAFDKIVISKSLTFFDEADTFDVPRMLKNFDWGEAKKFIIKETNRYFRKHAIRP